MEIIGRITKQAQVRMVKKSNRKVVLFTLAINDYYKSKDAEKGTKVTTYIDCAYWINPGIATYLVQGALVEVHGRIHATAYISKSAEAKATINCHVNTIKLHSTGNSKQSKELVETEEKSDLPF